MSIPAIKDRIRSILDGLMRGMYEKEKPVKLSLLSALAEESVFLLGPPGVAKSLIARRLKYAFSESSTFEYLMGKFSTPDEVFGPVSISKLKNEDKYERIIKNYLPGARIVFLDEIWKASPAIQNSLLTVLNEKVYRNGEQEIKIPLKALISASNELPRYADGMEALWDRFLIRLVMQSIQNEDAFNEMIMLPRYSKKEEIVPEHLRIGNEEYQLWREATDQVLIPEHVLGMVNHLRRTLNQRNLGLEEDQMIYVSDRRWRKMINLLRTAALLNDRTEVHLMDCFLMEDCIWQNEEQIEEAQALVLGSIAAYGYQKILNLGSLKEELEKLQEKIENTTRVVHLENITQIKLYSDKSNEEYAKVEGFWGSEPAYIRQDDLENLPSDEETFTRIFESSNNQFRVFRTFPLKREDEFTLHSKNKSYQLESEQIEREKVQIVRPDIEHFQEWNFHVENLLKTVDSTLQQLEMRKEVDSEHAADNLFVDASRASYVLQSLENAMNELLNMRLEIEKTKHSYATLFEN